MTKVRSLTSWISAASLAVAGLATVAAVPPRHAPPPEPWRQPVAPDLLSGLVWRNVGPFRGGRVAAVTGVIGQPGVFYAGLPLGGVWKTTSAGQTWHPIFDSVKEASSVGAIEVAPSDPSVIYVGMGDMITGGGINEGNGVYKSSDAGATWQHLGLDDTRQIPSIIVDPRDPNLVMIAAQGNVHAKSDMRGVYRSTDGGRTWTKTLYVDDETGIQKLARAFDRPKVILATTVRHYIAPGLPLASTPAASTTYSGTALFKSTDEGLTWKDISTAKGLPQLAGRTSVAIAMNTNAQRMYLIQNSGLYRSDDGGENWRQMDPTDRRVGNGQGGYNCGVYVDPQNPDIVYTINTSSYKSTDGGNTFTGFKGAPGGDDPQQLWIDPTNGKRMFLGVDQGATISLDGGNTWSSWYNQSTEQVYHLAADNSFPYWIYATQQDAGAIRTLSRGNLGEITPLDWSPVPGWEWGTIVPDPLNPNVVFSSGSGILKIMYPSEQWINVSPAVDPGVETRVTSSQPIVFSPINQHELLAAFQYVASSTDGGVTWKKISPDLTVTRGQVPPPAAPAAGAPPSPPNRSAIESMSASSVAAGTIWVGTSNGVIQVTRDHGATWQDVSIPNLPNSTRASISSVDASHQDAATAYVAVDFHNTGDFKPYFFRTRDYGKTWTQITNGMRTDQPSGSFARVLRADPRQPRLLFAGTESSVYVSFDDGDNWQSLMLNLPNTSYRDITFHGNDLVIGTYGRGIWVLDDYTVLRQLTPAVANEPVHFFKPDETIRVRRNVNADTPFPPEVPYALNPPDGVVLYYSLVAAPSSPVTMDVLDAGGNVVRHMSSVAEAPVKEAAQPPEPNFWIAKPMAMPVNAGLNRTTWDFRYDAPPAFAHSFEINANPGLTPPTPEGPLAPPGNYTFRLNVAGRSYTQSVTIRNDPRSTASTADIKAQTDLALKFYAASKESWDGANEVTAMRSSVASLAAAGQPAEVVAAAKALDAKLQAIGGSTAPGNRGRGGPPPAPDFMRLNSTMTAGLTSLDYADMAPTPSAIRGYAADCMKLKTLITTFQAVNTADVPALNSILARNNVPQIRMASPALPLPACDAGLSARDRKAVATHSGLTVSHTRTTEENDDGDDDPGSH
ncbi:MAG: hypothetical protein M3R65_09130 [Gemmatimonadota bacterium]|nr:hypothetical protein [Gemmatimonadota bacterium]